MYDDGGVDIRNAGGHSVHFVLTQRGVQRHQLAVQVGERDDVAVKQTQLPYPAAGQHLNGLAADAADAEHGHMGLAQCVQRGCAQLGAGAGVLVGHEWFLPYILCRPVGAGHFRTVASRQTFCIGMAEGRAYPAPTVHLFFRLARRSNTVS